MIGSTASRPPFPVNLDNWQNAEQVQWTFQHVEELFPTATIARGERPGLPLPTAPEAVTDLPVTLADGSVLSVEQVMAATATDAWMVVRDGQVVTENYLGEMAPGTRHLLMSVSKSIVGVIVGTLMDAGLIDQHVPVEHYVPQLAGSGYAGATVRDLLDMRSGIRFSENYLDPLAEVRVLEQAFGWAPRTVSDVPGNLRDFLATLVAKGPHGGPFEYRSCESDILGWLCESVTDTRFVDLASAAVWSRIGARHDAYIGVDTAGSGMFDGGICAALEDLARFGLTILNDGVSPTGERVVSSAFIADTLAGGPDSRAAFAASPGDNRMPGGMYRNQFWFPYPGDAVVLSLGIHGQMIYVNRVARTVAVKLSSWPDPQDAWKLFATLAAFDTISARSPG